MPCPGAKPKGRTHQGVGTLTGLHPRRSRMGRVEGPQEAFLAVLKLNQ